MPVPFVGAPAAESVGGSGTYSVRTWAPQR